MNALTDIDARLTTLEDKSHAHDDDQPGQLVEIHYSVLVDKDAPWYPRTQAEIEYAQQTYRHIKEVDYTGTVNVGVLPQMVEYTNSIPTKRWTGTYDVETALRNIARGDLPNPDEES